MEVQKVFETLALTVNADQSQRTAAESSLLEMENRPGFLSSLLQISSSTENRNVSQAATIYFKNKVRSSWDTSSKNALLVEEKNWVKAHILQVISQAAPNQRSILLASINIMICNEFYTNSWPELIPSVAAFIHSNDTQMVQTGLFVLLEIVKLNQWYQQSKRGLLNSLIVSLFPALLNIGVALQNVTDNVDAMLMLKTILKIYNSSIRMELHKSLQAVESLVAWVNLCIHVIERTQINVAMPSSAEELEKHPWWKCKKWAYGSLNSLMGRYARGRKDDKKYAAFAKMFLDQFAVKILEKYFIQIEKVISGEFVSQRVQQSLITYLEHCLKSKNTWELVQQHLEPIIVKLIFPLLTFTQKDLELWQEDAVEYIHKKIDPPMDDYRSPVTAAEELLVALVSARYSTAFMPVMKMINDILSQLAANPKPELKFGVMNMLCILSDVILSEKSTITAHMESFMAMHIFPELNSAHGFLRAKACDVLTNFSKLNYLEQQNLEFVFHAVLSRLSDSDLPVQVSAALALGQFLKYPQACQALRPQVVSVMQTLMNITNEIDLDTMTNTMELLVFEFAEELKPFATELASQLCQTFMRIMSESNFTSEEFDFDSTEDKTMAAMGVLKTLASLILAVESSVEIVGALEVIVLPAIKFILSNSILDLFEEVFEMIGTILFCSKRVTPNMWELFPLIYATFKSDALEYLEEMLPSLDNYIAYGKDRILSNYEVKGQFMDIITTLFNDKDTREADQVRACQLMESFMLNMRGQIDGDIPKFLELVFQRMTQKKIKTVALRVHCLEIVLNAIYYNPVLTLSLIDRIAWLLPFCEEWFKNITHFRRVHDKKLSILTACAVLDLPKDQSPTSLLGLRSHFLESILQVFKTYPEALQARDKEGYESDDEELYDEHGIINNDGDDLIEEEAKTLEALAQEAANAAPDDDEESDDENFDVSHFLEEDISFMTPLDSLDAYVCFANTFGNLLNAGEGPDLQSRLNNEQLTLLKACIDRAKEITSQ